MKKPDAALHNTDPQYLRALLDRADISQNSAAKAIGISPRMMRYYLGEEGTEQHRPAPYSVQFAIECLCG